MGSGGDFDGDRLYPYNPARVLAQAHLKGLSDLRDLFRDRTIKSIRHLYQSAHDKWIEARAAWEQSKKTGQPDFSHITKAERHLRRNFNTMIWETTARYGNTEWKRVKNERKGKVGPMNRYLNMTGAQLRNYAMTRFPFPEPEIVGREGRRLIAVYEDPIHYGQVRVNHTTLPELDFADMIRARVFELARKCFINNVPMREARKYVNLLTRKLSPFLEYLYTSGESGRRGFKRKRMKQTSEGEPDADQILREIVREIEALYGGTIGRSRPPTHQLSYDFEGLDKQFFLNQTTMLRYPEEEITDSEYSENVAHAEFLEGVCDENILRKEDAQWISGEVSRRSRWYGIKWHRMLTNGFPQPFSLRQVILEGDRFLEDGENWFVAVEVPVETEIGEGQADLVVFNRLVFRTSSGKGEVSRLKPVAVFDIKSKTAFNWSIDEEEKESKKHGDITVSKFPIRRRALKDREWEQILQIVPDKYGEDQLKLYARALQREYSQVTDSSDKGLPIRGTIVVDTTQEPSMIQSRLESFIHSICDGLANLDNTHLNRRLLAQPDSDTSDWLRLAAVVEPITSAQRKMLSLKVNRVEKAELDTNDETEQRQNIILYLTARANASSGPTAAWIAKYWHGLEYLQQISEPKERILLFDLTGDFSSDRLSRTRLHYPAHRLQVQKLWDRIDRMNISGVANAVLRGDLTSQEASSLVETQIESSKSTIVIVSGFGDLEDSTSSHRRSLLAQLQRDIVHSLSGVEHTVLWFSKPRVDENTSSTYQGRKIKSPEVGSPLEGRVLQTVWNLPVRPYAFGQMTSLLDDLRVIIQESADGIKSELIEVGPLRNWSSRFWTQKRPQGKKQRGKRGRVPLDASDVLGNEYLKTDLIQSALELLPHIKQTTSKEEQSVTTMIEAQSRRDISRPVLPRLTYQPRRRSVGAGKGYAPSTITAPTITHSRGYRNQDVREKEIAISCRVPPLSTLDMVGFDIDSANKIELTRVSETLDFLIELPIFDDIEDAKSWYAFLLSLRDVMKDIDCKTSEVDQIERFLETHPTSSDLWESLRWSSQRHLLSGLNPRARGRLEARLHQDPLLLQHTGNYLILLLLGVFQIHPSLGYNDVRNLWENLKPWHLMQLGLKSRRPTWFNVDMLWMHLLRKTNSLVQDVRSSSTIVKGQILVVEAPENSNDYWLFLEDFSNPDRLLCGVWRGLNPFVHSERMYWCLVRHDDIAESAAKCGNPLERFDVVVRMEGNQSELWLHDEGAMEPIGRLNLVRRYRGLIDIRGIKVSSPIEINSSVPVDQDDYAQKLASHIATKLDQISKRAEKRIHVEIRLDVEGTDFVIQLMEEDTLIEEIRVKQTSRLIQFLRGPLIGARGESDYAIYNEFYTWNPYSDRPYTHFKYNLPSSASEFSSLETRSVRLQVKHDESLCPIADGDAKEHGLCWRIKSDIDQLRMTLSDNEILRILAAGEIVMDGIRYLVNMDFEPDLTTREGVVFRESRSIAWFFRTRRITPGTYLEMDQEKLVCELLKHKDEIQLVVKSDKTDDWIYSWLLFKLSPEFNVEGAIKSSEETLDQIAESYFEDKRITKDVISNYTSIIDEIQTKVTEFLNAN
jgi:hypothetical protein